MTNSYVGGLQGSHWRRGGWEELRQCSMVIARYGVPGLATGTLGVLGPMRMSYAKDHSHGTLCCRIINDLVNDAILVNN